MIFRKCTQFSVCLRGDGPREGLVWLGSVETSVIVIKRVNGHWKQMQRQQSNKSLWIRQIPKNNWMHLICGIPFRIHRWPSRWPSPLPNWNQHSHTMHGLSMSFVFLTVSRTFRKSDGIWFVLNILLATRRDLELPHTKHTSDYWKMQQQKMEN